MLIDLKGEKKGTRVSHTFSSLVLRGPSLLVMVPDPRHLTPPSFLSHIRTSATSTQSTTTSVRIIQ